MYLCRIPREDTGFLLKICWSVPENNFPDTLWSPTICLTCFAVSSKSGKKQAELPRV